MHYDVDGRFQLRYSAPAPIGALVEQALKEAKDSLFLASSGHGHPVDAEASGLAVGTRGDAPSVSTRSAATQIGRPMPTRSRSWPSGRCPSVTSTGRAGHYRVYLHLSTEGAWVNGGGAIPRRLLDRFITDGVVQPVWETEGRPVSVGGPCGSCPAAPAG